MDGLGLSYPLALVKGVLEGPAAAGPSMFI